MSQASAIVTVDFGNDLTCSSPLSDQPAASLQQAFERRRADLRRLLAGRVGDQAEADDLLQDLYLKISSLQSVTSIKDPEAYCFRLAYNLAVDRRRSGARRRRREEAWSVDSESFVGETPVVSSPSAEEVVASRQELAAVLAAVDVLPPRSREVFRMHKLEGVSYAQTALKLGISVSAVEKHMMRALAAISRAVRR